MLQTEPPLKIGEKPHGGLYCLKNIIKTEGIRGLYRGMLSPLFAVTPMFAFCFLGYDLGNKIQTPALPNKEHSLPQMYLSGAIAGLFSALILAPTERIKCLVQAQPLNINTSLSGGLIPPVNEKEYKGSIDCLKKVYKDGGIRSVFKGTYLTCLRDVPSTGFYFVAYELLKKDLNINDKSKRINWTDYVIQIKVFFAGGVAGVVNWVIAYPVDVAKSKYQTAPKNKYKNISHVYQEIVKNYGFASFYKGFATFLIGAYLADGACFLGYELAR